MKPYEDLPEMAFWRAGVHGADPQAMYAIYQRKWPIEQTDRIATAGSCFAQHIARYLKRNGFTVLDAEPAPRALPESVSREYGFGLYSARYGNVYTVRQLLQLVLETRGEFAPADAIWGQDDRYYDALRPSVEPNGLDSPEEVLAHRQAHLTAVSRLLRRMDVFVFTLGLTEAWVDMPSGTVYPTAPGTIAGEFSASRHAFKNFSFGEVYEDLVEIRRLLREQNPRIRFLFTVSPVPLTATASGKHVLQATTYSKAVLRAVAGQISTEFEDVDYFPSYEIVTNPAARSAFYGPNLRTIEKAGVESVMRVFFNAHGMAEPSASVSPTVSTGHETDLADVTDEDAVVCEEALLEAFGPGH